jgi:hypothetical protein
MRIQSKWLGGLMVLVLFMVAVPSALAQWAESGMTTKRSLVALTTQVATAPASVVERPPVPEPPSEPQPRPPVPDPPPAASRPPRPCNPFRGCVPGPVSSTPPLCVTSDASANIVVTLCSESATGPVNTFGPKLTATVRIGGALAPDGTDCFIWGSRRGGSMLTRSGHGTVNGECSYRPVLISAEPVDFYAFGGQSPNMAQTPGYGLTITFA